MSIAVAWTFAPNNGHHAIHDDTLAVVWGFEHAEMMLIVAVAPPAGGQPILRRSMSVPHMALGQSAVRRR